jgi:hypothetical protein
MKHYLLAVVCMLGCGLSLGAVAEEDTDAPEGTLVEMSGPVEVLPLDSEEWKPATAGMQLRAGDTVRTGKKGRAFITLGDDVELRLGSETSIEIQLEENTDTRRRSVGLLLGILLAKVAAVGEEENPFEVHTANAVAGVRGTEFTTAVALDGTVRASVQEGKVVLEAEEKQVELSPGQFSEAEDEKAPSGAEKDPGVDLEAWRLERRDRILERAPQIGARWMKRVGRLHMRWDRQNQRRIELNRRVARLARKARIARHGGHDRALAKIRARMGKLVEESVRVRRRMRRVAVRIRAKTDMVERLAVLARSRGTLPPDVLERFKQWEQKSRELRRANREAFRQLRAEIRNERRMIRKLQLRYRDFIRRKMKEIRESLPPRRESGGRR